MKVLIFSDSHGRELPMRRVIASHSAASYILFCGDGVRDIEMLAQEFPTKIFVSVRGNCDLFISEDDAPTERVIALGGHRIFMTHGHVYGVKGGYGTAVARAAQQGADILIFGHTHLPTEGRMQVGDASVHYFNPGSIGSADHSYGVLTMRENGYLFSHGNAVN